MNYLDEDEVSNRKSVREPKKLSKTKVRQIARELYDEDPEDEESGADLDWDKIEDDFWI